MNKQNLAPIFKPKEYVLFGVLIMIAGILLNAYLPNAQLKVFSFATNGSNDINGPGTLILFGFIMAVWPFLKRSFDIVFRRKNGSV